MSTALNRLQTTLLEEKDAVTDTRKRNTILTLVAWLKKILQSPTDVDADTPIFSLTDLLPTELLLTKLMPQLPGASEGASSSTDRSAASSKRFSRQRNKRFNTVGVSKEELADARLYLQKKLLSENLASTDLASISNAQSSKNQQQFLTDDDNESRRKSLNIPSTSKLNDEVDKIIEEQRKSCSKSIDVAPSEEHLYDLGKLSQQKSDTYAFPNRRFGTMRNIQPQTVSVKANGHNYNVPVQSTYCDFTTASSVIPSQQKTIPSVQRSYDEPVEDESSKPMNKFSLKKLKIKRANTIDIPKKEAQLALKYAKGAADTNFNRPLNYHDSVDGLRRPVEANCAADTEKGKVPTFEPKTNSDLKFLAFMNKQPAENRLSWVNPNKSVSPLLKSAHVANNWTNKFDHIKNAFESTSATTSPINGRRNNFNHASTSPFIPVSSNKPTLMASPQNNYQVVKVPPVHRPEPSFIAPSFIAPSFIAPPQNNYHIVQASPVHKPVPAVANNYYANQQEYFEPKPVLRTQKSLPATTTIKNDDSYLRKTKKAPQPLTTTIKNDESYLRNKSPINQQPKSNTWANKYASMDNTTFNNVVNKLRSPVVDAAIPPPVALPRLNGKSNSAFSAQLPSSFNPLYIPLHESVKRQHSLPSSPHTPSLQVIHQTPPFPGVADISPQLTPYQTPISPLSVASPNPVNEIPTDFPTYTYTCTDYTRPACVSTYIPNEKSPMKSPGQVTSANNRVQAAPRVNPSPQGPPARLNSGLRRTDYTSSSEYLSDTNSSRSPQPYYNSRDYVDSDHSTINGGYNSSRNSQEFTAAKSQIMKYPDSQTATVVSHRRPSHDDADEEHAKKLQSFLRNNVQGKRPDPAVRKSLGQMPNMPEYLPPKTSPEQTIFSQVNKSYIAPIPPFNSNNEPRGNGLNNDFGNYVPLEFKPNLAHQTHVTPPLRGPIFPVANTNGLPKQSAAVQQTVRKTSISSQQSHANNVKQISSAGNRIYDSGLEKQEKPIPQSKSQASPMAKVNSYGNQYQPPKIETDKQALWLNGNGPKPEKIEKPKPAQRTLPIGPPTGQPPKPKLPEHQPPPHPVKYQTLPSHVIMNNVSGQRPAEIKRKQSLPSDGTDFTTFMGNGSDNDEPVHKYLPNGVLQRSKSGHTLAIMKQFEAKEKSTVQTGKPSPLLPQHPHVPQHPPILQHTQALVAPKVIQTPSTPVREDPNDEFPVPGKVQAFIESLNNYKNKPTDATANGSLQRSKSNHTLSLPKQYESNMKKSEVVEKERTVAAYFGAQKSSQGLQRSSSQHSMTVRSQQGARITATQSFNHDRVDINGNNEDIGDKNRSSTTSTTIKSAHHMKIIKKSQQGSMALARSSTMPCVNLLDETNPDAAFDDLFSSFNQ